jgi:hypothetical protein
LQVSWSRLAHVTVWGVMTDLSRRVFTIAILAFSGCLELDTI